MKPVKRTVNSGPREGEEYHVINGRLEAFERAIYDEDGIIDSIEEMDPTKSRFHDFAISGNGLKALKTLYKSVTGQNPEGSPVEQLDANGEAILDSQGNPVVRYELDLLSIAEELVGSTAWNNVFHTEPNEQGALVSNGKRRLLAHNGIEGGSPGCSYITEITLGTPSSLNFFYWG
jgi:hypothetical protein